MRFDVKNVIISSYNTSGASASAEPPTVDLPMSYTPIKVSYSRDGFDFTAGDDDVEKPKFEWIEIKRPPQPPSQPLPWNEDQEHVEWVLLADHDPDPLSSLLLPAVQSADEAKDAAETIATVWDDFIFG